MRNSLAPAILAGLAMFTALPAHACRILSQWDIDYIQYADVVVVGRITNYEIVLDPKAREDRARRLANSPPANPDTRRRLEEQTRFLTDYARFDVVVDEVLMGEAEDRLSVTWDNSTFGEPETVSSEPILIAMRDPLSVGRQIVAFGRALRADAEPGALTVLQALCTAPFMFPADSEQAEAVRVAVAGNATGADAPPDAAR